MQHLYVIDYQQGSPLRVYLQVTRKCKINFVIQMAISLSERTSIGIPPFCVPWLVSEFQRFLAHIKQFSLDTRVCGSAILEKVQGRMLYLKVVLDMSPQRFLWLFTEHLEIPDGLRKHPLSGHVSNTRLKIWALAFVSTWHLLTQHFVRN